MNSSQRLRYQFKYYTLLSIFYSVLVVTAQSLAYRMMEVGPLLEPGGIFIFPASFAVNDVIAEVYGPTLARLSIFYSLLAQAFFSLSTMVVNQMPYPAWWHHAHAFIIVFGASGLVFLSNLVAILISMVLNTQLIGKTKFLAKGRFFSLRSLLSSTIGELLLTGIIVAIALVPVEGFKIGLQLFINMFLFKFAFSIIIVIPASFLVVLFKRLDDADVYEENISLNPLKFLLLNKDKNSSAYANVIELSSVHKK